MQKCSYCGRESEDAAVSCGECGTSLTESRLEVPLVTPHRMMAEIVQSIWEYFGVKRRRIYLAGFLIGMVGVLVGVMHHPDHGFALWSVPVGGALGVCGIALLSLGGKLEARIHRTKAEGKPTVAKRALFVIVGLIAMVVVALLVAAAVMLASVVLADYECPRHFASYERA